jgi:hypothetical protein
VSKEYSQSELHEMMIELLNLVSGLTDWEIGFLDNINTWEGNFTDAQEATLIKIHNRMFNKY